MDIRIKGGQKLSGEITPSGSKNSAVHLIPCSLLVKGKVIFENVPNITDVERLVNIVEKLGSKVKWDRKRGKLELDNKSLTFENLTQKDLGNMKGTSLLWGALLSRFGKVDCDKLPGGCTLGIRPLKPIYDVLSHVGVQVDEKGMGVKMRVQQNSQKEVWLTEMSPTATTNLLMVVSSKKKSIKILGAASEPQVQDVCKFLKKIGVEIQGIGSSVLVVKGTKKVSSMVKHKLLSDHYEITTFLALGALTGGEVRVKNAIPEYFEIINTEFKKFNIKISYQGNTAIVKKNQKLKIMGRFEDKSNVVRAQPWPALPVDLLPIFIPLALASPSGYIMFHNWMYESGLFWTSELLKLGAEVIMCDPHRVVVMGGNKLYGGEIEAPYIIRAVVSLVMAAMIAGGETTILNADALYRGHPNFSENLKKLGAEIEEIKNH